MAYIFDKQFSVLDDKGRTLFQVLPANDLLQYMRVVANSLHLSERVVCLLVDMFPKSITSSNKYCMPPFHCACLNIDLSIDILMLFIIFPPEVIARL